MIWIKNQWLRTFFACGSGFIIAATLVNCQTTQTRWTEVPGQQSQNSQKGLPQPSALTDPLDGLEILDLPPGPPTATSGRRYAAAELVPNPRSLGRLLLLPSAPQTAITLPDDLNRMLALQIKRNPEPGQCELFATSGDGAARKDSRRILKIIGSPTFSDASKSGSQPPSAPIILFTAPAKGTAPAARGWAQPDADGLITCDTQGAVQLGHSEDDLVATPATALPQSRDAAPTMFNMPPKGTLVVATGTSEDTPLLVRVALSDQSALFLASPVVAAAPDSKATNPNASWNWTERSLTQSPGLRVTSYYRPTFIVRTPSLKLSLPPGTYTIALIHPATQELCLVERKISANAITEAACPHWTAQDNMKGLRSQILWPTSRTSPSSTPGGSGPSSEVQRDCSAMRDAGLHIAELLRSDDSLMIQRALDRIPASLPARGLEAQAPLRMPDEPIVLDGSFTTIDLTSSSNQQDIATYLQGKDIPALIIAAENKNAAGLREAAHGSPLIIQTRLRSESSGVPSSEGILTTVSNGVTFLWKTTEPSASLVPAPTDGLLAFTVRIPPYNLTEYIELYLNGKLWKRRVINRTEPLKALEIPIEERFEGDRDFVLSVFTWGRAFLPEFIVQQPKLRPLAILSRICFDVNKNGICDQI